MEIKVKLYGTLSRCFPGYDHSQGIEVEIPGGATAKDLLTLLEISESKEPVVTMEGKILKADDTIRAGVPVSVFQVVPGG